MTLLLGICTAEGPIIASDSQATGDSKTNYQKVYDLWDKGLAVCMAMSGSAANAQMAVQESFALIKAIPPKFRTVDGIRAVIKKKVRSIQTDYVDSVPLDLRRDAAFELLIAIRTKKEPLGRLFYTESGTVVETNTFKCLGSGDYLGTYLMRLGFDEGMDWNQALILAMRCLAAAKGYDAFCGGKSVFSTFLKGRSCIVPHSVEQTEEEIKRYESLCSDLLKTATNTRVGDESFSEALRSFSSDVRLLRERILESSSEMRKLDDWFQEQFGIRLTVSQTERLVRQYSKRGR